MSLKKVSCDHNANMDMLSQCCLPRHVRAIMALRWNRETTTSRNTRAERRWPSVLVLLGKLVCLLHAQQAGLCNTPGWSYNDLQTIAIKISVFRGDLLVSNWNCRLLFFFSEMYSFSWKVNAMSDHCTTARLQSKFWMKWEMPVLFIPLCPSRCDWPMFVGVFCFHLRWLGS